LIEDYTTGYVDYDPKSPASFKLIPFDTVQETPTKTMELFPLFHDFQHNHPLNV
jgi:hypothetical protein